MNPSASEKSSDSCLSAPSRAGSALSVALSGAAQFLELAGKAHDVDERRAQIVADDIGEPLDFVVGFAKIGGALVDGGFEVEIVVAQSCFGLVPSARRAPYQEDREAGQRNHEAGACDGDAGGEDLAAIGIFRADREQPRLFRVHGVCDLADGGAGIPGSGLPNQRGGVGRLVRIDEVHLPAELVQPRFDRQSQLFDVLDLHGIVAGQLSELVGVGNDVRQGALVIPAEVRAQSQKIPTGCAFGAADLEQQGVDLVLHLDGVNHHRIVFPRLVDEQHGCDADRHQHQESCRQQQDLKGGTPARGVRRYGIHDRRN